MDTRQPQHPGGDRGAPTSLHGPRHRRTTTMRKAMTAGLVTAMLSALVGGAAITLPVASAVADTGDPQLNAADRLRRPGRLEHRQGVRAAASSPAPQRPTSPARAELRVWAALPWRPAPVRPAPRTGPGRSTWSRPSPARASTRPRSPPSTTAPCPVPRCSRPTRRSSSSTRGSRRAPLPEPGLDAGQRRRNAGHQPRDVAGLGHQHRRLGRALQRRRADQGHGVHPR